MRPELKLSNQQKRDFGHMQRVWKVNNLSSVRISPLQSSDSPASH
jgi:hypothetical protein